MTIMTTITTMTTCTTQPQRLALWWLVTLHESSHQWVQARTPTEHWALRREAVGGLINDPQGEVTHNDGALRRDKRQVFRQTW